MYECPHFTLKRWYLKGGLHSPERYLNLSSLKSFDSQNHSFECSADRLIIACPWKSFCIKKTVHDFILKEGSKFNILILKAKETFNQVDGSAEDTQIDNLGLDYTVEEH